MSTHGPGRRHGVTVGQLVESAAQPGPTGLPVIDPNETDDDIPESLRHGSDASLPGAQVWEMAEAALEEEPEDWPEEEPEELEE